MKLEKGRTKKCSDCLCASSRMSRQRERQILEKLETVLSEVTEEEKMKAGIKWTS